MQSVCNSPVWPVLKADGVTYRMTIDFRALNAVTPATAPVVAKYNEIVAAVAAGSKWFSVIDLANAFMAIPLHPSCWYKFAFTYRGQQYAFTRAPQGFHSSPSICHAHVTKMWDQLHPGHFSYVISYVDDILIHTPTPELNREITREVLNIVQETGFKVNREKAQLIQQKVKYLGVCLGDEGRTPDQQRVEMIGKLPAPTDTHSLRALVGTFNFSREFIEMFSDKAKPLYQLLKKNRIWEWGPDQQTALATLKQDLAKAPALAYPDPALPFVIQLASSETSIGATLHQRQGDKLRVIAYASRLLDQTEQGFTPCERECLALVWSLSHWEFIIGGSKVIVQTVHSPLKYIISGKIQDGQVSNPRIAQWTLTLVNRGVEFKKEQAVSPAPYGLIIEGEEHTCPLPFLKHLEWPVKGGMNLADAKQKGFAIWFTDGSSFYHQGHPRTGYGAIRINDVEMLQGPVRPHSAQAAEVEAVRAVLAYESRDTSVTIYTDSDWTARAITVWLPLWLGREMLAADGRVISHADKWRQIANLIKERTGDTWVTHTKGHQKNHSEEAHWNNRADALAKAAAISDHNKDTDQVEPIEAVTTRGKLLGQGIDTLDLGTLQDGDTEIQSLAKKGKDHTGKYRIEQVEDVWWAVDAGGERHWIIPNQVRGDLIQFVHEQGHKGKQDTLNRVKDTGWWPGMKTDIDQWCDNCLQCAMVNADRQVQKNALGHQRIEGPWSRIQIDYIGPLPTTSRGNKYCLVIVDPFSKWVEAIPTKTNTAAVTAKQLFNIVFSRMGIPREID
uniref:Gypsy retrotransposon integrase-like protein 1 n=1 Tax=Pelodiscus sinensis TaxID=13735 RepID=K7EX76_PELSI